MILCKLSSLGIPVFFDVLRGGIDVYIPHATLFSAESVSVVVSNASKQETLTVVLPPANNSHTNFIAYSNEGQEVLPYSGGYYDLTRLNSKNTAHTMIAALRTTNRRAIKGDIPLPLLARVALPGVRTIESRTFAQCPNLQLASLNYNTIVGNRAFENCNRIKVQYIPAQATIKHYAFHQCTGIQALFVAAGATIEDLAFRGCDNIERVYTNTGNANSLRTARWYSSLPSPQPQIIEI